MALPRGVGRVSMDAQSPPPHRPQRDFRVWSARAWAHAHRGANWTWNKLVAAPWKRIALWTGGGFAVLVIALLLFVTFADWNAFRGPIGRFASSATGREIVIHGDLRVNPWSWTPRLRVQNLEIGNLPRYRNRGAFAKVGRADVSIKLLPLLIGRFDIVKLDLSGADVSLFRDAEGVSNWAGAPPGRGQAVNLPAIRHFSLRDGHMRLEDQKRHLTLDATFTTEESIDRGNPGRFALDGDGRINGQPFQITFSGAPLLNVRRDRPYAFDADVHAGATHIRARGEIPRPFDFAQWHANVAGSGPDLADLYPLIGLALPNTPPYALHGRVERDGHRYGMPEVAGRVGDSDLRGNFVASRHEGGRLLLTGAFQTQSLDFDDLLAVLGGAPDTHETASAEQRAMAANLEAQGRILPDARLDISRVRNMDAHVTYRAAHVRSEHVPLRGLALDINLDRGLLRLDPMTLELERGRVGGAVAINARENTPRVDMDVRLSNARMESILALRGEPPLTGALLGRAQLSGTGASVRQAAANANGTITLVTPHGEVREAFAELTGINVTRGLGLLLSHDQSKIDVRCGVASFRVNNGVARVQSMVFDTETMLIRGEGSVSLRDERMHLSIHGQPKEPRLIRFAAPITIEGPLRSPRVGIDAGRAAGQTGIAALLASLVAPIAAVLPFVDTGLAHNADCAALLAGNNAPHTASRG